MKPLPNLEDDAAMIRRGRRAAILSCQREAAEELRDACTRLQSCHVSDIEEHANAANAAITRLRAVARLALTLDETP